MSVPKHTPGEWKVLGRLGPKQRIAVGPEHGPSGSYTICELGPHEGENAMANARLIAAAPDMLKALNMVRAALEGAAAPNHEAYGLLEVYKAVCTVLDAAEGDCK